MYPCEPLVLQNKMADSSGDEDSSLNLTGFLFGNINEKGELEDTEVLDEESRRHLAQLSSLSDFGSLVQDITKESSSASQEGGSRDESHSEWVKSNSNATDFSDITELAEEEEEKFYKHAVALAQGGQSSTDAEEDYDAGDEEDVKKTASGSIVFPTVAPSASTLSNKEKDRLAMPPPSIPVAPATSAESTSGLNSTTSTSPVTAPLAETIGAGMSGSEISLFQNHQLVISEAPAYRELVAKDGQLRTHDGKTVTDLFPEFKAGQVLRFSRLFGPGKASSLPQQWRNAKKRKKKKKKGGEEEKTPVQLVPPQSPPSPRPEDCMSDDEDKLMTPWEACTTAGQVTKDGTAQGATDGEVSSSCEWRYGPASLWYEMLGVNEEGTDLDYGFKLKEKNEDEESTPEPINPPLPENTACFEMVSQVRWEDDVIWSPEDVKPNLQAQARAGWVPTSSTRTAQSYALQQEQLLQQLDVRHPGLETLLRNTGAAIKANTNALSQAKPAPGAPRDDSAAKPVTWCSIFPIENEELIYGSWEDKIIWDAEAMPEIPRPTLMRLDPTDENIILGIPADKPNTKDADPSVTTPKKESKKSKLLLGKTNAKNDAHQVRAEDKENTRKNMFNLSNDEYYSAKHKSGGNTLEGGSSNLAQHSLPAIQLQRPYFPTYMGSHDLRTFHRPPIKRMTGVLSKPGRHSVYGLQKHIKKKAKEREKERLASGGGEMFFMRTPSDLTGMDGELMLFEYSEEYPPLLMTVGMNTKIRNYHKRKPGKDDTVPSFGCGETVPVHQASPFLGQLKPGDSLQALENNLFRAPIYQHQMPETDFLIFRTHSGFYIRDVRTIFTVGQECPKFEVPGPNSKKANVHARDFLQIFIYRLFWNSPDTPRRIKMDDIKRAFPMHSESSIRKRLKLCADFKRTGTDCNWWVLKTDFRLPTEEEMRALVSPEQCCAYYSMQAAEQRLKDAGYGEKSLFSCGEDENDDQENKVDDEVRTAPWNTTRAFVSAMRGKCQLAVTGSADPTGCGEGFSYVRVPNKPMATKEDTNNSSPQIKKQKTVTGTDADLRRLSLKQARQVLRNFGVSDEEIKKLSRWEVIDVVRTMSTEAAKSGEEGMSKFARGSRFTIAEHQERYKEECQRIFELQNRVLQSTEVLSTDEESSSDESDIDELGKNLEIMLANKKTSSQLSHEEEEAERRELQKLLNEPDKPKDSNGKPPSGSKGGKEGSKKPEEKKIEDDDATSVMSYESSGVGRRLVINRTFTTHDGKEYSRREVVKNQAVVDAYLKVVNKDKRAHFASVDEIHKEEIRREKRRIQEQLRRIKRNQEKEKLQPVKKKKEKPSNNLKCGACGAIGHMRTNKNCPMYQDGTSGTVAVAMTDEQVAEQELSIPQDDIVKVEGTKITLGKAFLDHTNDLKRKSLVLRFPKESMRKKRRSGVMHCDYLKRPHKSVNRRRANPEVALQVIFEGILNKLKEMEESWPFHQPVSSKTVPDYYKIIKDPMDLQTMRENLRQSKYLSREDFMEHASLIVANSVTYNGPKHAYTEGAQKMLDSCNKLLNEKEDEIAQLEKELNPLLSDEPQIAFSCILENVVVQLRAFPESYPFHKPVSSKQVPDYYDVVKNPMDLETLRQQVQEYMYRSREEFLDHVRLIHQNSVLYNGDEHDFSKTADKMVTFCEETLKENEEQFAKMESDILLAAADDSSSYVASQPPSVAGLESLDNSMDGFPDASGRDEDSLMDADDLTADADAFQKNPSSSPPAEPAFKAIRKRPDDDDEEIIDVEGYGDDDSLLPSTSRDEESFDVSQDASQDSTGNFESTLLQDLEHSDSDSEEDDFPFGDGDEEDEEMEEEEEEEEGMEEMEEEDDSFEFSADPGEQKDSESS